MRGASTTPAAGLGKRAMPSWEGALTPEQIQNIWAYVRANAYQH